MQNVLITLPISTASIPPAVSLISAEDIANFSSTKARHGTICNCPPLPHKPLVIKAHQSDPMCPILLLLTFPVLPQVLYSFVGLLQWSPNFNSSTPIYGRYDFYSESSQLGQINFHSELYVALEPSFPVMVGRVKLVSLNECHHLWLKPSNPSLYSSGSPPKTNYPHPSSRLKLCMWGIPG